MPIHSAGLLLYRTTSDGTEVLLVHPGGPFYVNRDDGVWSIPKGEFDPAVESPVDTARREFTEETGHPPPEAVPLDLGTVVQKGGKVVHAFAAEGDLDAGAITSNTFTFEWPPRSGRDREFPEVDRAGWFGMAAARVKIVAAQAGLLDRLAEHLGA
ncbi:MAG: NUDIX domain-containing protein [Actinobacteria bacterium]|nr:NUDIX domain-containing protein [Actinomycetota bacterium]MBU1492757.1 NUDIX domain-containing protein [Actinomycetota bacterium]MBU1865138.1 NUDIX domain-containing protein [Actinomycetota bacterium]